MKNVWWILFIPLFNFGQVQVISYSDFDAGKITQSGEFYDLDALTASSNHYNLGSWIRLFSKNEKNSVILKINDCSSELKDTIKVSRSAAEILDLGNSDKGIFEIEMLREGIQKNPCKKVFFGVQLASFSNIENANLLYDSLLKKGVQNISIIPSSNTYKVIGGRFLMRTESEEFRDYLKKEFDLTGFITILE